jgi:dTDP-4-dehydrorhamnose reductase
VILVFGRRGQVARELARLGPEALFLGRDAADLADPGTCARAVREHRPGIVINAAAWTAVDGAEDHEAEAQVVNADAPAAMAAAAAGLGVPFLHVSTDYVFDGTGEAARTEDAPVAPLNAYGRTKLAGEEGVRAAGGPHAILRTSWVFSAHGANFVKTMLRLSETRDALKVVDDQVGGPTHAGDIARALLIVADALGRGRGESGTYHFAGAPDASWACFARETFARAGRNVTVTGIPTVEYPTPAGRPLNSRLDCSRIERVFDIARPDWRVALDRTLEELKDDTA